MGETANLDPVESLIDQLRRAQLPEPSQRKAIRERACVTLREAAAVLMVDHMTLYRWERGDREPTRTNAIAYRRLLDALAEATR